MGEKYILNRSEKFQFCIERPMPFCKNKFFCLQGWIEGEHLFKLETFWKLKKEDHAGFKIWLEIFGYQINFEVYDTRHWNYVEDRFYYYDEPELGWFSHKYRTEHYFAEIRQFIAAHPEIDKGYYRRRLIEYRLDQQTDTCTGLVILNGNSKASKLATKIYREIEQPNNSGKIRQDGWQTFTKKESRDMSVKFSEEKQIASFLYDCHAGDDEEDDDGVNYFYGWELEETLRKKLLKNGGMIILPSEQMHKKDKDRQIGKIVSYLKDKAKTVNKSLCCKNYITAILNKKYEIKCFNLGHYFYDYYMNMQKSKKYDKNSLCIEIFNAGQKTIRKIAEELCDILNLPEILLKDYHTGEIMRFEREQTS